jgi:hypothetical protein
MQDGFREGRGKAQGVLACIGCGADEVHSSAKATTSCAQQQRPVVQHYTSQHVARIALQAAAVRRSLGRHVSAQQRVGSLLGGRDGGTHTRPQHGVATRLSAGLDLRRRVSEAAGGVADAGWCPGLGETLVL